VYSCYVYRYHQYFTSITLSSPSIEQLQSWWKGLFEKDSEECWITRMWVYERKKLHSRVQEVKLIDIIINILQVNMQTNPGGLGILPAATGVHWFHRFTLLIIVNNTSESSIWCADSGPRRLGWWHATCS